MSNTIEPILQFFDYENLPKEEADVVESFCMLALEIVENPSRDTEENERQAASSECPTEAGKRVGDGVVVALIVGRHAASLCGARTGLRNTSGLS
jgi:hypothetical protein